MGSSLNILCDNNEVHKSISAQNQSTIVAWGINTCVTDLQAKLASFPKEQYFYLKQQLTNSGYSNMDIWQIFFQNMNFFKMNFFKNEWSKPVCFLSSPIMSTHCVHWRSWRNKVSLSYTDFSNADTLYYTMYAKCRHAPLLASPQPPGSCALWKTPACARTWVKKLHTEEPLPCHCLHLPAGCLEAHTMSNCCCEPPRVRDAEGPLPPPASAVSIHIHSRCGLPSPLPELEGGPLLAQPLQTSSSLPKPADISAI